MVTKDLEMLLQNVQSAQMTCAQLMAKREPVHAPNMQKM